MLNLSIFYFLLINDIKYILHPFYPSNVNRNFLCKKTKENKKEMLMLWEKNEHIKLNIGLNFVIHKNDTYHTK